MRDWPHRSTSHISDRRLRAASADGLPECRFGHAELLDDITDGWEAGTHKKERNMLITGMQQLAKQHALRISFLSGDVHCCGVGRLYTRPKVCELCRVRFVCQ